MGDMSILADCGRPSCPSLAARLHGQKAFLQTLLDAVSAAGILVLIIENGKIVHVSNSEIGRQFGCGEEEIAAGMSFTDIIHPDDKGRVAGYHVRRQAGEVDVPSRYDCSFVTKTGERREYEVSIGSMPGTVSMCVLAVCKEISERKRMERDLAASERQFRSLAENLADNIARWDLEGRYLYINPEHERTLGVPAERIIGTLLPDSHAAVKAAIKQVVATGQAVRLVRQSVVVRDVAELHDVCLTPEFDSIGTMVSVLGVGRNMTDIYRSYQERAEFQEYIVGVAASVPGFLFIQRAEADGRIHFPWVSSGVSDLYGLHFEDFQENVDLLYARYHPDDLAVMHGLVGKKRCSTRPFPLEIRIQHPGKGEIWVEIRSVSKRTKDGGTEWNGMVLDISERKAIEARLEEQRRQYRALADNSPDTVVRYDRNCRRIYVNPTAARTFNADPEDMLWRTPSEFPGWKFASLLERNLKSVIASGQAMEFEMEWTDGDRISIWADARLTPEFDKFGRVESVLGTFRDISELRDYQLKLEQSAFYDHLTGLPNRALLMDRLHQTIADAAYHGRKACVMMLDLDRFKIVNDSLGHAAGDDLLREVARRLGDCVRPYDTVARLGGDEFVILMPDVRDGTDLGRIGEKIRQALNEPFRLNGRELSVTSSLGIALFPEDGTSERPVDENAANLLRYADAAMYKAKRAGRNGFAFYSAGLTEGAARVLDIEIGLRHALARNEFEVHFQPKVSFGTDGIVGSEALLRWHSADLGTVPPDQFIPVAEDTGLILEIGQWVLRQACLAAREWNFDGRCEHKVAVNFSTRQFHDSDVTRIIADVLAETGCQAEWLEVEITESLLLDQGGGIAETLTALRDMGVTIAIDDFGTGYSSLSYLADFPIDTLKIDKSFIREITSDPRRAELVRAIFSIAECLGQEVVAEGVETYEQVMALKEFKCHIAQGWYYGHPVSKDEMAPIIERRSNANVFCLC